MSQCHRRRLSHASFSLINTLKSKDLVRDLSSLNYQKEKIFDPYAKEKTCEVVL